MCGFLAYIGDNLNSKRLESGLSSILHRGPDSSRILKQKNFAFGFNRLAIQDLSDKSMQPMIDFYGNSIIYNGEIYNFKEIKKELESIGYKFKTNGDVEVIMKSILEWGFEKSLKNSILLSKSKWELRRQIWNFLALEFLIDQFVVGNTNDKQKQKIQSALNK